MHGWSSSSIFGSNWPQTNFNISISLKRAILSDLYFVDSCWFLTSLDYNQHARTTHPQTSRPLTKHVVTLTAVHLEIYSNFVFMTLQTELFWPWAEVHSLCWDHTASNTLFTIFWRNSACLTPTMYYDQNAILIWKQVNGP